MRERRQKRLIDPLQLKIAYRVIGYWILYQFAVWNTLFCWHLVRHGQGSIVSQYIEFSVEYAPILVCFLLYLPAFAWDAMKILHRVAGPVYRVRQTVQDVAAHRPVRMVTLRRGDQLEQLRDDVNSMLVELARTGSVQFFEDTVEGVPDVAEWETDVSVPTSQAVPEPELCEVN